MTGSSVIALSYANGVAVVTDTKLSYGHSSKYFHIDRQFVLNQYCLIAYSGDCADFQWVQNYIECEQEEFRCRNGDMEAYLKPKMVHSLLTSYFYFRRSKLDPIWNTLIVAGSNSSIFLNLTDRFNGMLVLDGNLGNLGTF